MEFKALLLRWNYAFDCHSGNKVLSSHLMTYHGRIKLDGDVWFKMKYINDIYKYSLIYSVFIVFFCLFFSINFSFIVATFSNSECAPPRFFLSRSQLSIRSSEALLSAIFFIYNLVCIRMCISFSWWRAVNIYILECELRVMSYFKVIKKSFISLKEIKCHLKILILKICSIYQRKICMKKIFTFSQFKV